MSLTSSSYRYKLALHILMDEFGVIVRVRSTARSSTMKGLSVSSRGIPFRNCCAGCC